MFGKILKFTAYWMSLGAICVLAISAYYQPATLPHIPVCAFKQMTGRPCPGCGLTRAFCSISHGHFGEALYFNPFSFIYTVAVLMALWPLVTWKLPGFKRWVQDSSFMSYALPALLVAMLVYGVIRMLTGPFV